MSTLELPFAPPRYSLDDNGTAWWPPEPRCITWPEEWPHVAEVWQKYADEGERHKTLRFRNAMTCDTCKAEVPRRDVQAHQREQHPGEALTFHWTHPLWVWELMGCEDIWWGTPNGLWWTLDCRNAASVRWETDVHELGDRAADHFWIAP